jgi:hypothetical protein
MAGDATWSRPNAPRRNFAPVYVLGILFALLNAVLLAVPLGLWGWAAQALLAVIEPDHLPLSVTVPPTVLLLQVVGGLLILVCAPLYSFLRSPPSDL